MSQLDPQTNTALTQLLVELQNPDNGRRTAAEDALNKDWIIGRPSILLMGLAEQMQAAQDPTTRAFAAVLFRRISSRNRKEEGEETSQELFMSLPTAQKDAIRAKLLDALASESEILVRHKVGDAVADIARQYTEEDISWPGLLGALFNASQSSDPGHRENAFRIFATTPDIIEKEHQDAVLGAFQKGFKDTEITVRLAAVEAFASFFRSLAKKAQSKYFGLIPDILNVLPPIRDSRDDDQLSRALIALIDLAESAPKMFKPLFHNLVTFTVTVIQDKELEDQTRQNGLELMATFAEHAPQMCRKDSSYTSEMVTQCLSFMTDVGEGDDNAAQWCAVTDLDDLDENDTNHVAGEQCLDRLAQKLGGQTLLPPTFNWLPRMISSTSWRDRHAALMAISAISEGCRDLMEGELNKVLDLVLPTLRDAHPRVRWAGCNALGQMSTDFAGTMQEKYHNLVIPAIIGVLDSPEPRVQAHAAAALVNFCEEADREILEPYLDTLLNHLLVLLDRNDMRYVQEQALSTIATVADSAETAFGKYYDVLMPLLFIILRTELDNQELRKLRGKAMECATLIALAVGKEKMGADAVQLVNILGTIQEQITEPDDPQSDYLVHCWGRMCRVLQADFLPFLPAVMPPLLVLASAKADLQLLNDEDEVAQIETQEGWDLIPVKGKFVGIKTAALDEKFAAIELISTYAQNLEASFEPYVIQILDEIALPGLEFFFHDPVRVASAKAVPALLNSYKKAHGMSSELNALWQRTCDKILSCLESEPAVDTLAELYQCFYESVECMGSNCLSNGQMEVFVKSAKSVLDEYQLRVKQRGEEIAADKAAEINQANGEDPDGGEVEELEDEEILLAIEDDQNLLSDMNKSFHSVMKNHGAAFLSHWETLLSYYVTFAGSADATQRQWALCILDDVLEFCGPQSWNYHAQIIDHLITGIRDPVAANRQAACYGAGVAAHKGGAPWADFSAAILPEMFNATRLPNAREEDHVFATENACAAIGKILRFNASKVQDAQRVVDAWVETLPVVNDEEAAPHAYGFLVALMEQGNPAVTAPGRPEWCFNVVAQALEAETLQGESAGKVVQATRRLIESQGVDAGKLLQGMSPSTQEVVRKFF